MTLGRSGPGQGINISLLSYLHSGEFSEICDNPPALDVAEIPEVFDSNMYCNSILY